MSETDIPGTGPSNPLAGLGRHLAPPALATLTLAAGIALYVSASPGLAGPVWAVGAAAILLLLLADVFRGLRAGEFGLDILAALAMAASLGVGEFLAANVVALMYSGGQLLEGFASHRARREMTALLSRAPRRALIDRDGQIEDVAVEAVEPGDLILMRRGDTVPADGMVEPGAEALLDTSSLTGEAEPIRLGPGDTALSGSVNLGDAFHMRAARRAADSAYAAIVRLVEAAGRVRAPMARMADRYALGFLALSLAIAGAAWALTGDPRRAVAVLVIATPCPLILAVPVALIAGVSNAARAGVLVKGAAALEVLAQVKAVVLDKTGTLTEGRPGIAEILVQPGIAPDRLLAAAAALDQASSHPFAKVLIGAAKARGLALPRPEAVREEPGQGLRGMVEGVPVALGGDDFVGVPAGAPRADSGIAVSLAGSYAGRILLADRPRADAAELIVRLRQLGVRRLILATGDAPGPAAVAAQGMGLDSVRSGLTPEGKIAELAAARNEAGGRVLMVGDGVNDAPALAAADLGVAMGARGAAAAAEAADVVILVDRIGPLASGIAAAQRAVAIARQSALVGAALSTLGMLVAAFGYITPVQGALAQELIDVAVVLNALRALLPGRDEPAPTGHSGTRAAAT